MYSYEIAGIFIDVESDNPEPLERMSEYRREYSSCADLDICFEFRKNIVEPDGSIIAVDKERLKWLKKADGSGFCLFFSEVNSKKILVTADISKEWNKMKITCHDYTGVRPQESFSKMTWFIAHIIMGVAYRYRLLYFDGLVIHSSAIKHRGQAVIFSAPSGTGKSTHVNLWHKHINDVKTLNDDTPVIRLINNKPYVFGTPWSGSSRINSNDSAPLGAIVVLEQAQDNKIRELKGQEAILCLMPRAFLSYFDQTMMEKSVSLFERIILTTPVYLLQCRPDQGAVEMAYRCLF